MTSGLVTAVVAVVSALGGVSLGAVLTRRNEKRAQAERLLVEALNDAAAAIAEVAQDESPGARARYASAVARIALHGSPLMVATFRRFQDDATTETIDGRSRLLAAMMVARTGLCHQEAAEDDLAVLFFGPGPPRARPHA